MAPHHKGSEDAENSIFTRIEENKKLLIIKPKALDITWGNDPRYWRLYEGGSAELVQVCWLEVSGKIDLIDLKNNLNPSTEYMLQFKLQLKPDAFGWKQSPVYFMAKVGKNGKPTWKSVDLSQYSFGTTVHVPSDDNALKFRIGPDMSNEKLVFGLYEVWRGRWKGGMVIEEVIISPC